MSTLKLYAVGQFGKEIAADLEGRYVAVFVGDIPAIQAIAPMVYQDLDIPGMVARIAELERQLALQSPGGCPGCAGELAGLVEVVCPEQIRC